MIKLALTLAHKRADELDRDLTPTETRWVVRAGFRRCFPHLKEQAANDMADRVFEAIRKRCYSRGYG